MNKNALIAVLFLWIGAYCYGRDAQQYPINMSGANDHDVAVISEGMHAYNATPDVLEKAQIVLDISNAIEGYTVKRRLLQVNIKSLHRMTTGMNKSRLSRRNELLARTYLESADILMNTGSGDLGRDYLFDAKRIADSHSSDRLKLDVNSAISVLYHRQGQLEESLKYFEITHKLSLKVGDSSEAGTLLNNMGVLESELGNNVKSVKTLNKALELGKQLEDEFLQGMCRNNLGGSLGHLKRYDEAIDQLKQALVLFQKVDDIEWQAYTMAKLAKVMLLAKTNDDQKILDLGLHALHIGDSLELKDIQRRALSVLHKTYVEFGDYKNAYESFRKYEEVRTQLRGEKRKIQSVRREAKYEIEKQLAEERSKSEHKIALVKANKSRQEIISIAAFAGCFFLLLFMLLIVHRLRVVKRQKRLIEQQNEERKLLLKEIHHRIKNNFQVISSLLRLQANEENNERIAQAFDDAVLRIQSMASVHELIYKQEMFEALDFRSYLDRLLSSIQSYATEQKVLISAETSVEKLNIKTLVPLGITINELVTNSLKYAFHETVENPPEIKLEIIEDGEDVYKMLYRDNGSGYTETRHKKGFGIELIETVIEQLDGTIKRENTPDWKNTLEIQFKEIT